MLKRNLKKALSNLQFFLSVYAVLFTVGIINVVEPQSLITLNEVIRIFDTSYMWALIIGLVKVIGTNVFVFVASKKQGGANEAQ